MSANGVGVLMDSAAVPQFIAYHDDNNVDAQADQYGNFRYDLHKIWSTMGRVDQQSAPKMRSGFIEEGDPHTGYAAGSIQNYDSVVGAFTGVEFWNTVTSYRLWQNNLAGDYLLCGALAPTSGIMFHLGGTPFMSQPDFSTQYLSDSVGAGTWVDLSVTRLADFRQTGGYRFQRHEWTKPVGWTALSFGAFAQSRYWYRLKLNAPAETYLFSNVSYKDWLYGHFKHWYSHYDIQKGQTLLSSTPTSLLDDGNFGIRFREGKGFTVGGNTTQFVQLGTLDTAAKRTAVRKPWYVVSSVGGNFQPARLFGGAVLSCQADNTVKLTPARFAGSGTQGHLVGCLISGANSYLFGGKAGEELKQISDVRVVKDPSASSAPAIANFRMVGVGSNPVVDRLFMDNHAGGGAQYIFNTSALDVLAIDFQFGHDDVSVAQAYKNVGASGHYWHFVTPKWGGPNKKMTAATAAQAAQMMEWWYQHFAVLDHSLTSPLAGIRINSYDDRERLQLSGVTDSNGRMYSFNVLGILSGSVSQNLFCVENGDGVATTPSAIDTSVRIEINPTSAAEFNPTYQSLTFRSTFPRATEWDISGDYMEHTWQRTNWYVKVGLPLACPKVEAPGPVSSSVMKELSSEVQMVETPIVAEFASR